MTDGRFWEFIGLLDRSSPWVEGADWAAICRPAIAALSAEGPTGIEAWFETFARKLHALDTPAHHKSARYGWWPFGLSSDVFLYSRCHVVGSGRTLFERVLAAPKSYPRNMWAEDFLYIADHAWKAATGTAFDRPSSVSYDSFSNPAWRQA